MTAHWITECPHCGTSFRVAEQHLRAARGSVRCGSCLQIFNAINTLFPDDATSNTGGGSTPTPKPATPKPDPVEQPATTPPTSSQPTSSISVVEAFISGDVAYERTDPRKQWEDEQEELEDASPKDEETPPHTYVWGDDESDSLAELAPPPIHSPQIDTPHIDAPELDKPFLDYSWTNDQHTKQAVPVEDIEDEVEEEPAEQDDVISEPYTEPARDPYEQLEATLGKIPPVVSATPPPSPPQRPVVTPPVAPPPTKPLHAEDVLLSESRIPSHDELESEYIEQHEADNDLPLSIEPEEPHIGPYREPFRDALLSELEADPPRGFTWGDEPSPFKRWIWGGLIVILAGGLGFQHLMFHYNDYASTLQKPPFDGWMHSLCEVVSCSFIKTDLSLIANENLLIRAHPSREGFLIFDTMLYNHAPFEQPFPLLELSFSDMDRKLIARRVFKPEEYLTGDLKGMINMPINTPLHISFTIQNPSDLVTSYDLKLISSQQQ